MKQLLITIAALVLVGCGPSIHEAAKGGNIEAVKKHIAAGKDVNEMWGDGYPPLHLAARNGRKRKSSHYSSPRVRM